MLYARFIFFSFDIKYSIYLKLGFWKDQRTPLQIPAKVDHMILSDMTDLRESSVSCGCYATFHHQNIPRDSCQGVYSNSQYRIDGLYNPFKKATKNCALQVAKY